MMSTLASPANLRLLAWVGFYGLILLKRYDRYYIAEWQQFSVWIGGAILLLILLLTLGAKRRGSPVTGSRRVLGMGMETAGHYVPLFIMLALGPTMLGSAAPTGSLSAGAMQALERAREHGGGGSGGPNRSTTGQPHTFAPDSSVPADPSAAAGEAGSYRQTSLLDLYMDQIHTEGERIEIVGMLHNLGGGKVDWLPPEVDQSGMDALVYRYLISCCVADALPLTIVLDEISPQALAGMPQDAWVSVKGRLRKLNTGADTPLLGLSVDEFQPCPQPDYPYLSLYPLMGPGSKTINHGQGQ